MVDGFPWFEGLGFCEFDVLLGQTLRCLHPPSFALSAAQRKLVSFLAFPDWASRDADSNSFHFFRLHLDPAGSSGVSSTRCLFVYSLFRQFDDCSSSRGCKQFAVVLFSRTLLWGPTRLIAAIISSRVARALATTGTTPSADAVAEVLHTSWNDMSRWAPLTPLRRLPHHVSLLGITVPLHSTPQLPALRPSTHRLPTTQPPLPPYGTLPSPFDNAPLVPSESVGIPLPPSLSPTVSTAAPALPPYTLPLSESSGCTPAGTAALCACCRAVARGCGDTVAFVEGGGPLDSQLVGGLLWSGGLPLCALVWPKLELLWGVWECVVSGTSLVVECGSADAAAVAVVAATSLVTPLRVGVPCHPYVTVQHPAFGSLAQLAKGRWAAPRGAAAGGGGEDAACNTTTPGGSGWGSRSGTPRLSPRGGDGVGSGASVSEGGGSVPQGLGCTSARPAHSDHSLVSQVPQLCEGTSFGGTHPPPSSTASAPPTPARLAGPSPPPLPRGDGLAPSRPSVPLIQMGSVVGATSAFVVSALCDKTQSSKAAKSPIRSTTFAKWCVHPLAAAAVPLSWAEAEFRNGEVWDDPSAKGREAARQERFPPLSSSGEGGGGGPACASPSALPATVPSDRHTASSFCVPLASSCSPTRPKGGSMFSPHAGPQAAAPSGSTTPPFGSASAQCGPSLSHFRKLILNPPRSVLEEPLIARAIAETESVRGVQGRPLENISPSTPSVPKGLSCQVCSLSVASIEGDALRPSEGGVCRCEDSRAAVAVAQLHSTTAVVVDAVLRRHFAALTRALICPLRVAYCALTSKVDPFELRFGPVGLPPPQSFHPPAMPRVEAAAKGGDALSFSSALQSLKASVGLGSTVVAPRALSEPSSPRGVGRSASSCSAISPAGGVDSSVQLSASPPEPASPSDEFSGAQLRSDKLALAAAASAAAVRQRVVSARSVMRWLENNVAVWTAQPAVAPLLECGTKTACLALLQRHLASPHWPVLLSDFAHAAVLDALASSPPCGGVTLSAPLDQCAKWADKVLRSEALLSGGPDTVALEAVAQLL